MANRKWQLANREGQIENGDKRFAISDKRWGPFDAVLLPARRTAGGDVPCSNTGVLAKRIEARYRITPKAKQKLIKIQNELLKAAATMINPPYVWRVKPEGRIAYSTLPARRKAGEY